MVVVGVRFRQNKLLDHKRKLKLQAVEVKSVE